MSRENVDLTREAVDAWNRGDVAGFVSYLAPDVEMLPTGGVAVHTPVFHGRDEVAAWFTDTLRDWNVLELSEREIRDVSDSTVVWLGRFRVRAAASGVELDQEWAMHGLWANHKVVRLNTFRSWIEALKAVGLGGVGVPNNLDRVRSIYAAWERGDFSATEWADSVDLVRAGYEWFNREKEPPPMWHPDGEFINAREDPDHAIYRGFDAIRMQHQGWFDSYPDLHVEPIEVQANGDLVFVWTRFTGHGAESEAAMEMELAHVVTIESGKTRRIQEYFDRAEALKAVGLTD